MMPYVKSTETEFRSFFFAALSESKRFSVVRVSRPSVSQSCKTSEIKRTL